MHSIESENISFCLFTFLILFLSVNFIFTFEKKDIFTILFLAFVILFFLLILFGTISKISTLKIRIKDIENATTQESFELIKEIILLENNVYCGRR